MSLMSAAAAWPPSARRRAYDLGVVRFYREKLSQLKQQLVHLRSRQHPKYVAGLQRLQQQLQERLDYEDLVAKLEVERIERDYEAEKTTADRELEERKADLMESLYNELDEKRKQIELEYHAMDLTGTSHNVYPANKKSLRRRPNEPAPLNEKRQRKTSPQQIVFQLCDADINDDLKAIGSAGATTAKVPVGGQSPARCASVGIPSILVERHVICAGDPTAIVDGSKLTFDGKCFLRAQAVFVETSDLGKLPTTIQTIGNTEIYLKSIGENKRIVITLSELQQGRAALKKR
uniref:Uncharacterized protein n=1 Tax=Plectus sambesii TaxID=2011161 RepID=A0A914WEZ3_9BILA